MEEYKILLNKNKSKKSINVNKSLTTQLNSSKRLLPIEPINETLSQISIYNFERENCNNIRLTIEVNPICSNVLFNNITEIIKDEGSKDVKCLNYSSNLGKYGKDDFNNVCFKDSKLFYDDQNRILNSIRDTQLSNKYNNFNYHCGLDIFNNHIIRSKTFKTICPLENKEDKDNNFNTISDLMRSHDGISISGYSDEKSMFEKEGEPDIKLHMYLNEEIEEYKESVENNLIEKNGWFGFTNVGKMKVYPKKNKNNEINYDWFKVINSRKSCDFIDLYPERDLFYFDPKYNTYKHRVEKNWNYCITYPSSSTTDSSFINVFENHTTLKVMYFDDTINNSNGTESIKIFTVSKHGLKEGDYINLYSHYKENEKIKNNIIIKNAKVIKVENDYLFYIFRDGIRISKKWINFNDYLVNGIIPDEINVNVESDKTEKFKISEDRKTIINDATKNIYYSINNEKVNIDDKSQEISFVKLVNGNEVKYYIRIFSKLPNWKFSKKKVNEEFLESNINYSNEYKKVENEFESHVGKLAYSRNIYNDNIGEIVFTDDINIDYLKDNLNRPITDLYLTIIKNNEGYKEWYGKRGKNIKIDADNIEFSHCFGKITCGFRLSDYSIPKYKDNVILINNIDNYIGNKKNNDNKYFDISNINDGRRDIFDNDEIQYNHYSYDNDKTYSGDSNFYGDLCCYSYEMCDEQIIQDIDFRFNTAQRELITGDSSKDIFDKIYYDEIISDDYDEGKDINNKFKIETKNFEDAAYRKEGYYYKPHYKIRINTISSDLETIYPRFIKIKTIDKVGNMYKCISMGHHDLGDKEYIHIYDKENKKLFIGSVEIKSDETSPRLFYLKINDKDIKNDLNKNDYVFFKKSPNIPNYSSFKYDDSCRFLYRKILKNGFDNNSEIEIYPFTNNAFYINKKINLYLRRQDPSCLSELRSITYPYGIPSNDKKVEKENKFYNEDDIQC